jgi:putative Mg2+ transporter-C (MgtC) family protein
MDWWAAFCNTLSAEFSDISDVSQITSISLRLVLAAVLGGLMGYERERKGKAAGLKTHMLVTMGAALFVLIPKEAGVTDIELSRIIQGVITGVGFLGAGAILKSSNEEHVTGLTTAAGIWLAAAIGITVGLGREASAVLSTLFALGVLYLVPRYLEKPNKRTRVKDNSDT